MRGRKRKFSLEFKIEAVKRGFAEGASTGEVAAELGIYCGMLYKWRTMLDGTRSSAFPALGEADACLQDQVRRLRKALERVCVARDFLKTALLYSACDKK